MKILMLTPYLPYPLYSGGQTRSFNLIKNLSKNHDITLFSFIRNDNERQYLKNLAPYCQKIKVFKRRTAWSLVNIILAALTPFPFLVVIYLSRTLRNALIEELGLDNYDLIHAETFYVMPNIPASKTPVLLVEQTIEFQVYQHFMNELQNPLLKLPLWLDVQKVKFWEKYFWNKASKVIAVSQNDKEKMLSHNPALGVEIVPNGVDTEFFKVESKYKSKSINKSPTILYVGNFRWLQNREAVEILIKEIWPLIKKQLSNSKLWIVGIGIDRMKKLLDKDINFNGQIEDIRLAYRNADLVLAPIRGPGGTRLKVLEAMAAGCPVVTTPVGIEGIGATDNEEVIIAKTNEELAQMAVKVINNPELKNTMILKARKFITQNYDWSKITHRLEKIYENVCQKNT